MSSATTMLHSNVDILEINFKIQKFIDYEGTNIEKWKKTLLKIELLLQGQFNLRHRMIHKLQHLKDVLTLEVQEYENLKYFKVDVDPLIERYHMLNNQTMVIPFFNTNKKFLNANQKLFFISIF